MTPGSAAPPLASHLESPRDVVVIDARTNTTLPAPEVDETSLTDQLTAHRDALAGEGEMGFGYRIPDRFKLEWLMIPKSAVRASLEDSPDLGPIQLRKSFMKDPSRFGAPANSSDFSSRADQVRTAVLDELTDERMKAIAKFLSDQLQFPRRGIGRIGLHYDLPADWADAATELHGVSPTRAAKEFDLPLPAYRSSGQEWLHGRPTSR